MYHTQFTENFCLSFTTLVIIKIKGSKMNASVVIVLSLHSLRWKWFLNVATQKITSNFYMYDLIFSIWSARLRLSLLFTMNMYE